MQDNSLGRTISNPELKAALEEQKQSEKKLALQENQLNFRIIKQNSAQATSNIFNDYLYEPEFSLPPNDYQTCSMDIQGNSSNLNDKMDSIFREIDFPSQEQQSNQGTGGDPTIKKAYESLKPHNLTPQSNNLIASSSKKQLNIQKNNRIQAIPTGTHTINLSGKTNCVSSSTGQLPMKGSNSKQTTNSSLASLQQPTKNPKPPQEQTLQGRQSYLDISEQFLLQGQPDTLHELPRKKTKQDEKKSNSQFFEDVSSDENEKKNNDSCQPLKPNEQIDKITKLKQPIKKQSNGSFTKEQLEKMHKTEDNDIPKILSSLNQQLRNTLIGEKVEAKLFKLLKEFDEAKLKTYPLYELRYSKDQELKQLQSIQAVCEKELEGSVIPILQTMIKYGKVKHIKIVAIIMRCQFMTLNANKKYEVIKERIEEAQQMLNNSDFIESEKNEAKEILESLSKYTEKNK